MEIETKTSAEPLDQPRFQLSKNLSVGVWNSKLNRVKLTKLKGKFIHTMGYSSDYLESDEEDENQQKPTYLYPEEALYQMENTNLIVCQQLIDIQIPMSIQQCYETFFKTASEIDPNDINPSAIHLDEYRVYSHLVRMGYILRRVPLNEKKELSVQKKPKQHQEPSLFNFSSPLISQNEYSILNESQIFNRLNSFIPSITMNQIKSNSSDKEQLKSDFRVLFDVYQPDKSFKKSKPSREPVYRISTSLSDKLTRWPNLKDFLVNDLRDCKTNTSNTKHLYAFVDNGDVLFYSFNLEFEIPSLYN